MNSFKNRSWLVLGYVLVAIICMYMLVVMLNPRVVSGSNTKLSDNVGIDKNSTETRYYLCTDYRDMIHCDPSLSNLKAFEIEGNWHEIYRPSGIETYIDGKYGKALKLDGTSNSESVEINNTSSINPKSFSVSFWVKRDVEQESPGAIISHSSVDEDAGWDFIISENGTVSFEVAQASGNKSIAIADSDKLENNGPSSSESEFINIVGTFNGTTTSIYSNGHLDEQRAFNGEYMPDPDSPLKIGVIASSAGTLLWSGTIDDLSLYNRSLNQDEVRSIYESRDSYPGRSPNGLISHWPFDGSLDDVTPTGYNHNGSLRTLISGMIFTPDGRLFFTEKNTGLIRIMENDRVLEQPFANITDSYVDVEQGILGLAVDPHFEKNHYIYLYYTANNSGNGIVNRLVRFTESNNTAKSNVTLIDDIPATTGFHSGGAIGFGPDDKIYLGVGDGTIPEFAQNPSVLLGKVLRIDRDGKIPKDNPFLNSPVYTLGHRNLYGIAFDNNTGFGIIAENGDELYDEINLITKGGNYGFPTLQPPNISPEKADPSLSVLPVRSYWRTPAPTQTIYYTGERYPELKDRFLMGTFDGDIYALKFDPLKETINDEEWINFDIYPYSAIIAVASSPLTHEVYFASNAIYKMTSIDSSNKEQTVFPVSFKFTTTGNNVTDVKVSKIKNATEIIFEFQTADLNEALTEESELTLQIEIPKYLVDNIYNFTVEPNIEGRNIEEQQSEPVKYKANNSTDMTTNILSMEYSPLTKYRVEILGPGTS